MGNEASLPMNCAEFDSEEIKRLGKRFKKLVSGRGRAGQHSQNIWEELLSLDNIYYALPLRPEGPGRCPGRGNAGGAVFCPTFGYYLCTVSIVQILS